MHLPRNDETTEVCLRLVANSQLLSPYLSADIPANKYSLCILEIFVIAISFGQTASQAPVKVQLPNPSLSIWATMLRARFLRSGPPWGSNARWAIFAAVNSDAE